MSQYNNLLFFVENLHPNGTNACAPIKQDPKGKIRMKKKFSVFFCYNHFFFVLVFPFSFDVELTLIFLYNKGDIYKKKVRRKLLWNLNGKSIRKAIHKRRRGQFPKYGKMASFIGIIIGEHGVNGPALVLLLTGWCIDSLSARRGSNCHPTRLPSPHHTHNYNHINAYIIFYKI